MSKEAYFILTLYVVVVDEMGYGHLAVVCKWRYAKEEEEWERE